MEKEDWRASQVCRNLSKSRTSPVQRSRNARRRPVGTVPGRCRTFLRPVKGHGLCYADFFQPNALLYQEDTGRSPFLAFGVLPNHREAPEQGLRGPGTPTAATRALTRRSCGLKTQISTLFLTLLRLTEVRPKAKRKRTGKRKLGMQNDSKSPVNAQ